MKIGTCLPSETGAMGGGDPSAQDVLELAKLSEQVGFDSVWLVDHFLYDVGAEMAALGAGPPPELMGELYGAWEALTFAAGLATNMHKGLASLGVITNGSVRDLDQCAQGFQMLAGSIGPAHAFNHCVEWNIPVTVAGMRVHPGDLIHADQHGAVVVPVEVARGVPETAVRIADGEAVMIKASQRPDFSFEVIEKMLKG